MPLSSSIQLLHEPAEIGEGALLGGKYRLERLLAEGGMGNVWLARNELLGLPVALKIVRPDARGKETTARLLMEARVQANMRHPNVARVFDYGQTPDGDSFLVIELLDGCSLAELLDGHGSLPPVQAVKTMLPIIDALCAAHRAGVVHRDIKPDNIFIARTGDQVCPKLLDFGVAKLTDNTFQPRLTNSGGVVGSPAYMSPEQARGADDVDSRADVWAVCVVLYEAVSGRPAFDAENYHALLRSVIENEPAPLTEPELASLWSIVRAGLEKNRAERTATMRELGASLARWLVEQGEYDDASREPLSWHWEIAARVERTRAAAGRHSIPDSTGPRPKPVQQRESRPRGNATFRERRRHREVPRTGWRMSFAAVGGASLLAFGFGQAWNASDEPAHAQAAALVRPAAASLIAAETAKTLAQGAARSGARPIVGATERPQRSRAARTEANAARPQAAAAAKPEPRVAAQPKSRVPEPVRAAVALPPPVPEPAAARAENVAETVLRAPPPVPRRRAASEADLGLKNPW